MFPGRDLRLEPPEYFATEAPDADRMTYAQLRRYIRELRASGFNVVPQTVALHRKIAFPFVTLIMTLIAVPFAVTTGRRGALYGIGVGHRAGARLLADHQRLRRDRQRRDACAGAGRLGAEPDLRRRRGLPAADGPDLTRATPVRACVTALPHVEPHIVDPQRATSCRWAC